MAVFCSQILRAHTGNYRQGSANGPKQPPYLPLQAPVGLWGHVAQLAEQLTQQPGPSAGPVLILCLPLSLGHSVNGLEEHTQMRNMVSPKS